MAKSLFSSNIAYVRIVRCNNEVERIAIEYHNVDKQELYTVYLYGGE